MGTIASIPALSAASAPARVVFQVGARTSGTKVIFGIVLVQNVPSFSLLSLKIGLVDWFFTGGILPDVRRFAQMRFERVGAGALDDFSLREQALDRKSIVEGKR